MNRLWKAPRLRIRWVMLALVVGLLTSAVVFLRSGGMPRVLAQSGERTLFLPLVPGPAAGAAQLPIIPNQYIVVLHASAVAAGATNPSAASVADVANAMAAEYGGEVIYTYDAALFGFAATFSADSAAALQANPAVDYIEPDRVVQIDQDSVDVAQTGAPWGLDRIDQASLPLNSTYNYNVTGNGVHAYIIDTGVRTTHNEFAGRIGNTYSAIAGGVEDCNGHGTHVAGTLGGTTYGVAKQVTIHPVRVLACNGSGSISGVIAGIDWVTADHIKPAVANMSLGGGASASLDNAVAKSIAAGVTYAVAAGNSNTNACNASPARLSTALTVAASTSTDSRASFSNYGSCVDLFAPGQSILSAYYTSNTAVATLSGTSMAAPHVAGVAALYLQTVPQASPADVAGALLGGAGLGHIVTTSLAGSPNRLLYMLFTGSGGGETTTPTATPTNTPTATPTPTLPASSTATPTVTPTSTPANTPTPIATPPVAACLQRIVNADFEAGATGWTQSSAQGFALVCGATNCGTGLQAHSGTGLAWLGGADREKSRVSQTLTIPAGQPATLNYWRRVESEDTCGYDYGYVYAVSGGTRRLLTRYSLCSPYRTAGWAPQSINLNSYAGRTVQVEFYVTTNNTRISSMFIDDVTLLSGTACTAPAAAGMDAPMSEEVIMPLDEVYSEPPEIIGDSDVPVGEIIWRR